MNDLIYMNIRMMRSHPHNMRRFYDAAGIRELADSIKAQGILQPLLVTPNPDEPGAYWVIIGNRRYHAGRLLGDECPAFPVRVIEDAAQVEQMLMMATENLQREDIDPVSQALHFKRLMEREGLSMTAISRRTGISQANIAGALMLLELPEPIQKLIVEGRLQRDPRVARALLSIPDDDTRVKLAERFADDGTTTKGIIEVCERVLAKLGRKIEPRRAGRPTNQPVAPTTKTGAAMIDHAKVGMLPTQGGAKWKDVREAAGHMCKACDAYTARLREKQPEPAWAMLAAAAGVTCEACGLHEFEKVCASCPGVAFLKALVKGAK